MRSLIKRLTLKKRPITRLPNTLGKKQVYVLPTRHGILFLVILAGMLMGSINYDNNLGFMLTFLLGAMAFISMIHTSRNLHGMQIISINARPVFAGESAVFEIAVRAGGHPRAAVTFDLSDETDRMDVETGATGIVRIRIHAEKRGMLASGPLRVSSRYPLGIFYSWSNLYLDAECLVYPRPLAGPLVTVKGPGTDDGEEESPVPGTDDFHELRAFQPGDSLKHIAWKAYSRGQGLMTKAFVGQTGSSTVMLDWHATGKGNVEHKVSRLSGMVMRACREQLDYGLQLPGKTIEPGRGDAHRHRCLKALALFAPSGGERE